MHKKSTAVLTTFLMLVLVLGALAWGAHRGWTQERAQVESHVSGLQEMLSARQEVATNILKVAERHLNPNDAQVAALRRDVAALGAGSLRARSGINDSMEKNAKAVLLALQGLPSVQTDERDRVYANAMLPQALEQSAHLTQQAAYNQLALDYNQRKQSSLSGRVAGMLGVQDAEMFVISEGTP